MQSTLLLHLPCMQAFIKTVVLLSAFLFPAMAGAKCAMNGIYPLSQNTILNRNGLIILEFYGASQSLVPGLNKTYPVYLLSGKEKVPLQVAETLRGEFMLIQVVLKATADLTAGKEYELHIGQLPDYEREPQKYNGRLGKWETLTFTISNEADLVKPSFGRLPAETKKTMIALGCGPARWVYFSLSSNDESETFVRARVKNKATGKLTEFILLIENGRVMVGHGMCSGGFHFDNGTDFEVTFALMDQSGNSSETTEAIAFRAPSEYTDEE